MNTKIFQLRTVIIIVGTWTILSILLFIKMTHGGSKFIKFGPNEELKFFDVQINNWTLWACVVIYTILNQAISALCLNIFGVWLINNVQNRENHTIDMKKTHILVFTTIYYTYLWMEMIIGIQLYLTQIDFMIFIIITKLIIINYTIHDYIREKEYIVMSAETERIIQ